MVQEYTINILKPIYPDKTKNKGENCQNMMEENYRVWKEVYEKEGFDPISKTTVKTFRNRIAISENLPLGEEYAEMIKGFLI